LAALAACAAALALVTAPVAAASTESPAWSIQSIAAPANFLPGEASGEDSYQLHLTNSGGAPTYESPITITDTLPKGIGAKSLKLISPRGGNPEINEGCAKPVTVDEVTTVSCKVTEALQPESEPARLDPGNELSLEVKVTVPASASGALFNRVRVSGGGAVTVSSEAENQASAKDAKAGFEEFRAELTGPDGKPATRADSYPYQYTTTFAVNTISGSGGSSAPLVAAGGDLREIDVDLPPGLVGNPTATSRCSAQQFNTLGSGVNECPAGSVVGLVTVQQLEGGSGNTSIPLYNLQPPQGMPAQLGFQVLGAPLYINTKLRSGGDYGITGYLENVTEANRVTAARITIWGVPGEESHDPLRGVCAQTGGLCPVEGEAALPFLRLPSSCQSPLLSSFSFETWARPPASAAAESEEAAPTDCAAPDFSPEIEAQPTTDVADSPTGLRLHLHLPQEASEAPEGVGEADLRDLTTRLPSELLINPASANGLVGCGPAQIGLLTPVGQVPARFSSDPAGCPDASKVGTVRIETPLLDHPLAGGVYVAAPNDNPFNSLFAIYLAVNDPETGVVLKLAGKVEADPNSGRLTVAVGDAPQLPVEDLAIEFFQGPRAVLRTPPTCTSHTSSLELTPWTSPAGDSVSLSDSFSPSTSPGGGACPTSTGALPDDPAFSAGPIAPQAGAYSPFVLTVSRLDGSQPLSVIDATLPPGLSARLAGIPECSPVQIAIAESRIGPGQGALEQRSPACPAASQVGSVTVVAGAGSQPIYLSAKAYLAGPYKGAPISLLILAPAIAGPFDLGTVVVRIALYVDPTTAQLRAVSDPLPSILSGIQLDLRSLRIDLDRLEFTTNPTSCAPMSVSGTIGSSQGSVAAVSDRFQVGECRRLGFKPRVSLRLIGAIHRSAHPKLRVSLSTQEGDANIQRLAVTLPGTELLDNSHIRGVCSGAQFAAHACPAGSIYGHARAWTPLLDRPLEGPIYLRSSNGKLPDLVVSLGGQIHLDLVAQVNSVHGRIRDTFGALPDAPLSKVVLTMKGGRKGLLVNTGGLCARLHRAGASFAGQNGKRDESNPVVKTNCGKR
jgi:hypothetical protein